jgi:TonB family protein
MDKAEALKWFALEANANGDERPELYSAFDSIAAKVHQSEREEALSRARLWAVDFDRRSPSPGRKRGKSLMSIFRATYPRLAREVKPFYPKAAMERKIEGTVEIDCVVNAYGTVGECQVVDSLDSVYGLDQEALKAVRQWRFRAGTIRGKPASIPVTIQLTFTLKQ